MTAALHAPTWRGFASDNYAGVHPEVLEAIATANGGHMVVYGETSTPPVLQDVVRTHLGEQAETFPVFNGTGPDLTCSRDRVPRRYLR